MLKTQALTKKFGGLTAVSDFDMELKDREILGIIGPNGAGKTTAFNLISGFLKPTEGSVVFKEEEITGLKPLSKGLKVSVLVQPVAISVTRTV